MMSDFTLDDSIQLEMRPAESLLESPEYESLGIVYQLFYDDSKDEQRSVKEEEDKKEENKEKEDIAEASEKADNTEENADQKPENKKKKKSRKNK